MEKKIKICIHCGVGGGHDQTCPTQVQTVWKSSPPMTQSFLQSEDELFNEAFLKTMGKDDGYSEERADLKTFLHASHARLLEHLRGEVMKLKFSGHTHFSSVAVERDAVLALLTNNE